MTSILSRPYGKGKVSFITAARLSDAPPGETVFWYWPQWPQLADVVLRNVLDWQDSRGSSRQASKR